MSEHGGARRRRRVEPGGRQNQLLVRLTDEERARIEQRAAEMGLTPASYLAEIGQAAVPAGANGSPEGDGANGAGDGARMVTEVGRPLRVLERRAVAAELMAVRRLLSGVATNLNQLARVANTTGHLNPSQLAAAAAAVIRYLPRLETVVAALDPRGRTWNPS